MVACMLVYDIKVVDFIEMMLGSMCGKNARHTGIEPTAQHCEEACLFEAAFVSPLPAIFKFSLFLRLIISGIEIMDACLQASLHNCQVLIGQRHVDDHCRLKFLNQCNECRHIVSVNFSRLDMLMARAGFCVLCDVVTFFLGATGQHDFGKYFWVLRTFDRGYTANAASSNNEDF